MDQLTPSQARGLEALNGRGNVFVTGKAGSGKSFLINHWLAQFPKNAPRVLASTGAAALMIGGCTFHRFFSLGIMTGGAQFVINSNLNNRYLKDRLRATNAIVIDEISMLDEDALRAAEALCRHHRNSSVPWGGIRVVAVGDMCQLPPVSTKGRRDWAFLSRVWEESEFAPVMLTEAMRQSDAEFLDVLNKMRIGVVDETVSSWLNRHVRYPDTDFNGTHLFGQRAPAYDHNMDRLAEIDMDDIYLQGELSGKPEFFETLLRSAPVAQSMTVKIGARVMLRTNKPPGWANGTIGILWEVNEDKLVIETPKGDVHVERHDFDLVGPDKEKLATLTAFPIVLAWAITIHKAQGATFDEACMDLGSLWEPGHAYVALSRVRQAGGVYISKWTPRSIRCDKEVLEFYRKIEEGR